MNLAVVVFVKTPGLSPLKTRLAKDIGQEAAEDFFKSSVKETEKTLQEFSKTGDVNPFWSVAEKDGLSDPLWQSFPRFQQVGGGLGDRMHGAYEHLRAEHDFVILLGADCPHLPLEHLVTAKKALFAGDYGHVIGPTEDGGFYLFGSGTEFSLAQWNKTEYSQDDTRMNFEKNMGLGRSVTWTLPELFDVDDIQDYKRLKSGVW